jgi:hypothetical protein
VVAPALQDGPSADVVYSEGVMDMVSVSDGRFRLVMSDARLAAGAPDLSTRPLSPPSVALYAEPDPTDLLASGAPGAVQEAAALREALVGIRETLRPAEHTGAPVSEALREVLRERGYWAPGTEVPEAEP